MSYTYQTEKLNVARHMLMLPHSRGEADSIAHAFHEVSLALGDLDLSEVSEEAQI